MKEESDKITQEIKVIEALGNRKGKKLFSLLLMKYEKNSPQIRSAAVQAMRKIADADSVNFFTRVTCDKNEKGWIRNSAIEALIDLDCPDKLPLFGSVLNEIIDFNMKHLTGISYAQKLDEIPGPDTVIGALMRYGDEGGTDISVYLLRNKIDFRLINSPLDH